MLELVQAGGWLMIPIILCSVLAVAICVERFWSLRERQVAPATLLADVWSQIRNDELRGNQLRELRAGSPLGQLLAAVVSASRRGREAMRENVEEVASHVVHDLERYLNLLGSIAAISPLLGLLGTVVGIIKELTVIRIEGAGSATALAGGIAEALITTAAGLFVAIPALFFYRHFQRRIDELLVAMEQEALKLIDVLSVAQPYKSVAGKQAGDGQAGDAQARGQVAGQ